MAAKKTMSVQTTGGGPSDGDVWDRIPVQYRTVILPARPDGTRHVYSRTENRTPEGYVLFTYAGLVSSQSLGLPATE
jgi:hypothetical protein